MNTKDLAVLLNGREYRSEITKAEHQQAKAAGLAVIFGASDDLMELAGALNDELGAPRSIFVDAKGLIPEFNGLCEFKDWAGMRDYFARFDGRQEIEALWCAEPGLSWSYKTTIPHETFEILEDGEPYCRGIVFALADVGPKPAALPDIQDSVSQPEARATQAMRDAGGREILKGLLTGENYLAMSARIYCAMEAKR